MTDYRTLIQGDLFDIMESEGGAPFYNTMQILHDEEHETNSPDRLPFFQDLLKNKARTPECDRSTLAPWLLVYIWQKTELPNYTREAWRTLMQLDIADELIIEAAIDILQHHPHGALRAEVLQWEDSWRPHWDNATVIALSGNLAFDDPHPEVRINAIQHYAVEGIESSVVNTRSWVQRMLEAMQNDAAPEVRAAIIRQLSYISRDLVEPQLLITSLREALTNEQNGFVACRLLSLLVSKGRFDFQLETAVIALNYVKSSGNERFAHEQQAILKRLRNYHANWLEAAPFEDIGELQHYLESHFKPETTSLEERVVNYRTLMQTTRPPLPSFQDLMDLFFDSQHTTETMGLLLDDLGDMGFRSLFATVASPVPLATTRVELLSSMIDHLKTTDANGNVLGSVEPMKNLLSHGVKSAMKIPQDAEKLWSLIYQTIAEGPEDWTWALSELKWRTGQFELEPLVEIVGTASNRYAARGATELVVELFAKEPSRERATAVAEAWTLFANRTDLENYVVYNV
ncbi:MAG: HEAT repeat domain-containing protein, partial [Cyanobacteria bacterium P01_D01_bin.56]